MPRYKREKIDARVATEKFSGAADQATAKGQAGIAQEQKGLSAQHGQRARQEVQSFSQRLNSFSNQINKVMGEHATSMAKKDGVFDVMERRRKAKEISVKYADNPELRAEKMAELTEAIEADNFSVYGKVYNDTASSAYINQASIDANNAHEESLSISDGNPEIYKDSFKKYMDVIIEGAPTDITKTASKQLFEKIAIPSYEKLYRAKRAKDEVTTNKVEEETIEAYQEQSKTASEGSDMATVAEIHGKLKALLLKRVQSGKLSPVKAQNIIAQTEQQGEVALFTAAAVQYAEEGQWKEYMQEIFKSDTEMGKRFNSLQDDQRENILKRINQIFDGKYETELKEAANQKKYMEMKSDKKVSSMYKELFTAKKIYSDEELQELQARGKITGSDKAAYEKFSEQKTVQQSLMDASNPTFLRGLSDEDIRQLPGISPKDKMGLVVTRNKLLADKSSLWTASPGAKVGYGKIKRFYGFTNDMFNFGAESKTKKAFDKMTTAFEDEAEKLAAEGKLDGKSAGEVSTMMQSIANTLIKEEKTLREEKAGTLLEKQNSDKGLKIKAEMEVYNDGFFKKYGTAEKRSYIQQAMITLKLNSIEETKKKLDEMEIAYEE